MWLGEKMFPDKWQTWQRYYRCVYLRGSSSKVFWRGGKIPSFPHILSILDFGILTVRIPRLQLFFNICIQYVQMKKIIHWFNVFIAKVLCATRCSPLSYVPCTIDKSLHATRYGKPALLFVPLTRSKHTTFFFPCK